MHVLGIDPSLRSTGIASVGAGGVVTAQHFPTDAVTTLLEKREQIRYIVGRALRFAPDGPLLTVIERPYVPQGKGGAGDLIERCGLFWLLVDQFTVRGPVAVVTPSGRAMYGADDGNADKKKVLAAVREAFPNLRPRNSDEADAVVLASMGARHLGAPIDGPGTKKQLEAMAKVAWPVIERKQ